MRRTQNGWQSATRRLGGVFGVGELVAQESSNGWNSAVRIFGSIYKIGEALDLT